MHTHTYVSISVFLIDSIIHLQAGHLSMNYDYNKIIIINNSDCQATEREGENIAIVAVE